MSTAQAERPGDAGAFSWNAGGWFGGQVGATLWLGILGALLALQDLTGGLVALGAWAVPNVLGIRLWRQRARRDAYASLQLLIAVAGLCALAAVAFLSARSAYVGLMERHGTQTWSVFAALLVYPAIMLQFWLQQRAARRAGGVARGER